MARSYELTEAMSRLIAAQPFYAVLLMDLLTIEETDAVPTAARQIRTLMASQLVQFGKMFPICFVRRHLTACEKFHKRFFVNYAANFR